MKASVIHIHEVAARSGVSVHTIRYYEREGLLPRPERSPSGYRLYPPEAMSCARSPACSSIGSRPRQRERGFD